MPSKVKFFKLYKKFVDEEKNTSPEVQQLKYYTLAIGHHVGVVDCFSPVLTIDKDEYFHWIQKLPEGKGRKKLEGLAKWGELEINNGHISLLESTLSAGETDFNHDEKKWTDTLRQIFHMMKMEPAIYLVVRLCEETSDNSWKRNDGR